MDLSSKVAIVTGAGSGMGRATAELFAERGAKVVLSDINEIRLNETVAELQIKGYDVIGQVTNVAKSDDIQALFAATINKYNHFDILVNNAGIMDGMEPIGEITDEKWDRIFDVNTKSLLHSCRYAVNYFKENGIKGSIVNNLSLGGLFGARAGVAYTASKHAGVGITKNTAFMYQPYGIRCNAIAPGGVATNIGETMTDVSQEGYGRMSLGMSAAPTPGQPKELAQAIVFLASDDASYINGAILTVDGGWSAI